jgi:hypothetical protein
MSCRKCNEVANRTSRGATSQQKMTEFRLELLNRQLRLGEIRPADDDGVSQATTRTPAGMTVAEMMTGELRDRSEPQGNTSGQARGSHPPRTKGNAGGVG